MLRPTTQRLLALLLLVAVALASCDAPSAATPAAPAAPTSVPTPLSQRGSGDTLRLILWQAPVTLNPYLSTAVKDWVAARITYEPLASYDQDGQTLVPFLAAEIPSLENGGLSADGTAVTWKLRSDVKWSDGQPFTAEDVKFTYEFITTNKDVVTFRNAYQGIESVDTPDPYTVRVDFGKPTPGWVLPFVGLRA